MHVGEMVKEVRLRRGLSQEEFAVLLGVTQQWVSLFEGRRSCTVGTLERVADAVGMELRVQFVEVHLLGRR
jgi:transcriptional regulator with XRE-family HTH domain